MAEEEKEMTFDPTMKKKKKKKKPFDLDAALGTEGDGGGDKDVEEQEGNTTPAVETKKQEEVEDIDISLDLDDFSKMKKKKKKKKVVIEDDEGGDEEKGDKGSDDKGIDLDDDADDLATLDLPTKKKKKKKTAIDLDGDKENDLIEGEDESGSSTTWSGSDRDYTYDELLTRVFQIMRDKNPEIGEKKRFVMRPPQVVRVGAKKSSFANFTDICKMLHRQPKHLLAFLLAELGTSGSIDGNNQLIIKGRFQQKQIENVLRRYIKEYVTCHTCRSPETILQKDTRLYFLQCESCGSRCSVASIKSGFQALTGKRAAIRAKTT